VLKTVSPRAVLRYRPIPEFEAAIASVEILSCIAGKDSGHLLAAFGVCEDDNGFIHVSAVNAAGE